MSKEEDLYEEGRLRAGFKTARMRPMGGGRVVPGTADLNTAANGAAGSRGAGAVQNPDDLIPVRGITSPLNVTMVSVMILPADKHRKFLHMVNSDLLGMARVSFGTEATLLAGMPLPPGGGGILLDNNVPTSAVFIIGSIANNPNVSMTVA